MRAQEVGGENGMVKHSAPEIKEGTPTANC